MLLTVLYLTLDCSLHCTVLYLTLDCALHCTVLYPLPYTGRCSSLYCTLHWTVLQTVLYTGLSSALSWSTVLCEKVWGVGKSTAKLKLLCSFQYSVCCCVHYVLGVDSDFTEHSPGWLHLCHYQVWPPMWVQQQETAGQVGGAQDYQARAILIPLVILAHLPHKVSP